MTKWSMALIKDAKNQILKTEKARPPISRHHWTFFFISCCVLSVIMSIQLGILLSDYLKYAKVLATSTVSKESIEFPAVTLCNQNKLLKKNTKKMVTLKSLGQLDDYVISKVKALYVDSLANRHMSMENGENECKEHEEVLCNGVCTPFLVLCGGTAEESIAYSTCEEINSEEYCKHYMEHAMESYDMESFKNDKNSTMDEDTKEMYELNEMSSGNVFVSNWMNIYSESKSDDFQDVINVANFGKMLIMKAGHKLEDFIIQCSFGGIQCNMSEDFTYYADDKYGNCYTYNPKPVPIVTDVGAELGLALTVFLDPDEYVGILSHEVGLRLQVHANDSYPAPETKGWSFSPGHKVDIALNHQIESRLKGYTYTCHEDDWDLEDEEWFNYTTLRNIPYDQDICRKLNQAWHVFSKCKCTGSNLLDKADLCNPTNSEQFSCQIQALSEWRENITVSTCDTKCQEVSYKPIVSETDWPSDNYALYLISKFLLMENQHAKALLDHLKDNIDKKKKDFFSDPSSLNWVVKESVLRLHVYFGTMNSNVLEESIAISFYDLLSNIGGTVGLYIGASALTFINIAGIMYDYVYHTWKINREVNPDFSFRKVFAK